MLLKKTPAHRLYETLSAETFAQGEYEKHGLDEDMYVIKQLFGDYWKPRYLVDEKNKTAVEFMNSLEILQTVCADDIDWASLEGLPEDALYMAKHLSAAYPTFVRRFAEGIAEMSWQLNPDGRYYMDDEGYGMTDDEEIEIYSYISREGRPLVKIRAIKNLDELRKMKEEARKNLKEAERNRKISTRLRTFIFNRI